LNTIKAIVFSKRFFLSVAFLVAPCLLGFTLILLGINSIGFVLAAIYPQVFLNPYIGYLHNQGDLTWLFAFIHWFFTISLFVLWARKDKKGSVFLFIKFIIITGFSVWLAHSALELLGTKLVIDSI